MLRAGEKLIASDATNAAFTLDLKDETGRNRFATNAKTFYSTEPGIGSPEAIGATLVEVNLTAQKDSQWRDLFRRTSSPQLGMAELQTLLARPLCQDKAWPPKLFSAFS